MEKVCLSVDIGASNGKILAGVVENKGIKVKEIHRFPNKVFLKNSYKCWDLDNLFENIKKGIKKCKQMKLIPLSISIDTWAVDFILLDKSEKRLTEAVSYRDPRTEKVIPKVNQHITQKEFYIKTGIQFQPFNTSYQLYYLKEYHSEIFKKAETFLMIPDYINFLLTGRKFNEYTNATTTQLINIFSRNWDNSILKKLGINQNIFQNIIYPNTYIGSLKNNLVEELGIDMKVIAAASHDTGSAVASVSEHEETIYISSGTWSLIGIESQNPTLSNKSFDNNFTNEGGMNNTIRFQKNIMGLWIIQEIKRLYENKFSFKDLTNLAYKETEFNSYINVNDSRFLNPENMIEEIILYCRETNQPIPKKPGEISKCAFYSLSISYKNAIDQIEKIHGYKFKKINIIGGGSQNKYLNQLISNITQKEVISGPVEASSIGNLISQFINLRFVENLSEAREILKNSLELEYYFPQNSF